MKTDTTLNSDMAARSSGGKPNKKARATIARVLAEAIDRSLLPAEQIAKQAGVGRQYIYYVKRGDQNLTIDVVGDILEACGTSLEELIERRAPYGRDQKWHDDLDKLLKSNVNGSAAKQMIKGLMAILNQEST
jgi:transcriptional regulator with XRE-family HTH domain